MKKTLIALAVLGGASSAAYADGSNVTLYGNIDIGIMSSSVAGTRTTGVQSTQISPSYFGFKGSEDLGNGLKAGFDLEGGFMPSTGSGNADQATGTLFGRTANVTLGGDWGTLALGLQWDPAYL
ncbi:MAG TPA: porin, partial [Methylobacter sp.]